MCTHAGHPRSLVQQSGSHYYVISFVDMVDVVLPFIQLNVVDIQELE
jgi:hypothetical protein